MNIESILVPGRAFGSLRASSKKRAIEFAAEKIAETMPDLEPGVIYRNLIEREKLGTTAIGHGVAMPHCRLTDLETIVGSLFVFEEAVEFSAPDDLPVSIMFVLLVPEAETNEHLRTLATLATAFSDEGTRASLIEAADNQALYDIAITLGESSDTRSASGQ